VFESQGEREREKERKERERAHARSRERGSEGATEDIYIYICYMRIYDIKRGGEGASERGSEGGKSKKRESRGRKECGKQRERERERERGRRSKTAIKREERGSKNVLVYLCVCVFVCVCVCVCFGCVRAGDHMVGESKIFRGVSCALHTHSRGFCFFVHCFSLISVLVLDETWVLDIHVRGFYPQSFFNSSNCWSCGTPRFHTRIHVCVCVCMCVYIHPLTNLD
jgi:hypothetical protein